MCWTGGCDSDSDRHGPLLQGASIYLKCKRTGNFYIHTFVKVSFIMNIYFAFITENYLKSKENGIFNKTKQDVAIFSI